MDRLPKIACYGFVEQTTGSVAGANFLILEELLRRGFEIHFYGWKGFTYPQGLFHYPNFRYFTIPDRSLIRTLLKPLPTAFRKLIYSGIYPLLVHAADQEVIRQEVLTHHQKAPYDLLLFLGLCSTFRIDDISVISWVQSPPHTEWFYIRKLKQTVVAMCGLGFYLKLKTFYQLKMIRIQAEVKASDILICGSQWAREQFIAYGVTPEAVKALPYPIDVELFNVAPAVRQRPSTDKTVFLWLGRIDPRKRFDLLMEAYSLLLTERQDVHLKIIGTFRAKGYQKLIDTFDFPEYLEYQPHINRADVPALMAHSDVLIQPSEGENFGSSVAEALCCGLPVIVGSTNGTKDYISGSSFMFDAYDPESLKRAMVQAIEAVARNRSQLTLDARRTAEQNFSIPVVVDQLQTILQEAVVNYRLPARSLAP